MSPGNDSERLLFRNLFENLVRLDCQQEVRPGLAESWTKVSGRPEWIFTLREGATFPVGTSDSAGARAIGIDSAVELDDRRLRLLMRDGFADSLPRALADPALVMIDGLASGSGPGEGSLLLRRRGKLPVIDFRSRLERDARDALDREVDLVVTRDPTLVDYVSNRAEFVTFPLPWSRTYVLVEPGDRRAGLAGDLDAASTRSSLAKDAVQAGARAAEPPYWWADLNTCEAPSPSRPGSPSSRVVYRKEDEVARGLAERIVALAPTSARLLAAGLDTAEFTRAVRDGSERAYVIALPRQSLAPCRDSLKWVAGGRLLPLIDTRAYAIVRRGAPPLAVEWDGTVRVVEP